MRAWGWSAGALALAVLAAGCFRSQESGFACGAGACDDGDPCNGAETCDPSVGCQAGTAMVCDDRDACTEDSCAAGECAHVARDLDGDGHADPCAGGDDCVPGDPERYPGAVERCNGLDDDCDLDVDEGLEFGLIEEMSLPEEPSVFPRARLDDGVFVGTTWEGFYNTGNTALAFSLDGPEPSLETLTTRALVASFGSESWLGLPGRALVAKALLPVRTDPLGNAWFTSETITVWELQPGRSPLATTVAEISREEGDTAKRDQLRLGAMGEVPVLAWMDQSWGIGELWWARLDDPGAPRRIAQVFSTGGLTMTADPTGATLAWSGGGAIHAARIGTDPSESATVTRIAEYGAALESCSVPSGTALLLYRRVEGDQPGSGDDDWSLLERILLNRSLEVLGEPTPVLEGELGQRMPSSFMARCVGNSILVLESFSERVGSDWMPVGFRLFRIEGSGEVTDVDQFAGSWAFFVEGQATQVVTSGDSDHVRTYGCLP